jgi:ribonuclease VapC
VIVLDTSAILAILWGEPEAEAFMAVTSSADGLLISAATRLELQAVCLRARGRREVENVESFIQNLDIRIVPFGGAQLDIALSAYETYRHGRRGLNYGDCFSYALAKSSDLPLLFKGEDFAATDVRRAL